MATFEQVGLLGEEEMDSDFGTYLVAQGIEEAEFNSVVISRLKPFA